MKNILFYLSCFVMVLGISCTKDEDNPDRFNVEGGVVNFTNVPVSFVDFGDLGSTMLSFSVENDGAAASGVKLVKSYNGGTPVAVETIGSFPKSYNYNLDELLSGFGITANDIALGDVFSFYIDGEYSAGGANYKSVSTRDFPVSCKSSLAGEYDYTTDNLWCANGETLTGKVTFSDAADAGTYEIDDWSFGGYPSCYNGFEPASWGTLILKDFCNEISVLGEDNYGDTWEIKDLVVDGNNLSFLWINTYGESGSTTVVNPDGWPPLKVP